MTHKTIKISEENYIRLLEIASDLQKRKKAKVSFDEALSNMESKKQKNKDIMKLAGAWEDMNDEEAKSLIKAIYDERKIVSRRL